MAIPNNLKINVADLMQQPVPATHILSFTDFQLRAILAQSSKVFFPSNHYDSVDAIGRAGKYQFNAVTLSHLGYLKSGVINNAPKTAGANLKIVKNSSNWSNLNGCISLEAFLGNSGEQELAVLNLYQLNADILSKTTSFFAAGDTAMQAGFLTVAHISSVALAQQLYQYFLGDTQGNPKDIRGYVLSDYYNIGAFACVFGEQFT